MAKLRGAVRIFSAARRFFAGDSATVSPPSTDSASLPELGVVPPARPSYQTHLAPVYSLPFYGTQPAVLKSLPDTLTVKCLRAYGGLVRRGEAVNVLRERLEALMQDRLTISGVVVSDKMNKSVVVAAQRRAFVQKIKFEYSVTRRFMAHDEFNVCREGDLVTIRSCRPLSKRKTHVVVRNYGDRTRIGEDKRAQIVLDAILDLDGEVPPPREVADVGKKQT